ncbi:hypothetical protein [uncultured Tateyamaria sp.]|uniref:hypothetical protein n=1 Tax=uncultured Tateyamaria sp. TaxID=455651 RepID=UPI00262D2C81|nr:hypothetical protein [uncultured Tateyamaria sp.]
MPKQIDKPLATDLSVLPHHLITSILATIDGALDLCDRGDTSSSRDFRGAYALALHLAPIAGLSKTDVAQLSNTSLSTFNRWLCAGSELKPHRAHVAGLFLGLRKVAQAAKDALSSEDQPSSIADSKAHPSAADQNLLEMAE